MAPWEVVKECAPLTVTLPVGLKVPLPVPHTVGVREVEKELVTVPVILVVTETVVEREAQALEVSVTMPVVGRAEVDTVRVGVKVATPVVGMGDGVVVLTWVVGMGVMDTL